MASGDGDVEEGELPDAAPPPRGERPRERAPPPPLLPASASEPLSYEERERSRSRMPLPLPPRSLSMLPPPPFARGGPGAPPFHPRVVISPRGPPARHHGGRILMPPPQPAVPDEQARQAAKDEREKEELTSLLRELTRYVTVQDAMRSLDTVCVDLKKAIKKLDKLLRKVKKKKTDDLASYPDCLALSKRVVEGLRSVNVVVGTSIGHTHSMDAVLALFRSAMNYRHDVFVPAHKQELEAWVRTTKVLKVIVEEKEQAKQHKGGQQQQQAGGNGAAHANGHGGPQHRAGSAGGDVRSDEPGSADGDEAQQQQQQQGEQRHHRQQQQQEENDDGERGGERLAGSHQGDHPQTDSHPPSPSGADAKPADADGAPPPPDAPPDADAPPEEPPSVIPPPPPEAPPPPAEPHPDDLPRPDANGRGASPPLAGQGSGVLPSGSGLTSGRARASAALGAASPGFRFSIVINSTAADIVQQQQQEEQARLAALPPPQQQQGEPPQQPLASQPVPGSGSAPASRGQQQQQGEDGASEPPPPPQRHQRRRASAWDRMAPAAAAEPSPMQVDDGSAAQPPGGVAGTKRPHAPSSPLSGAPQGRSGGELPGPPPPPHQQHPHQQQQPSGEGPPHSKRIKSEPHHEALSSDPAQPPSLPPPPPPHGHARERGWDKGGGGGGGGDAARERSSEPPSSSAGRLERLERLERDRGRSRDRSRGRSRDRSRNRSRDSRDWSRERSRNRSPRSRSPRARSERDRDRDRDRERERGGGGSRRWEPRHRSRSRTPLDLPPRGGAAGPHHGYRGREGSFSPERGGDRRGGGYGSAPGPAESPLSDELAHPHHPPPPGHHAGPHSLPNGHGPRGGGGGGGPAGGWSFEDRERHRAERERGGSLAEARGEGGRGGGGAALLLGGPGEAPSPGHLALGGPAGPHGQGLWEREGADEVGALLRRHRLVLALDLDHTLLNSVRFADLDPEVEAQLGQRLALEASTVPDHQRELYRSERLGIWTKLRPGAREFLLRAAEKFELWVYSAGTRPYADAMASLLDPEDRYFEGRIVAAGGGVDGSEGPSAQHNQRLLAGLQQRAPAVLAVDDAGALWPLEHRLALLAVERYLFFPATRRRFGLEGRSLLQINRDECPDRGMLMTMWHLMERLHGLLFTYLQYRGPPGQLLSAPPAEPRCPPWDVRNVLHDERRKVLHGVYLAFSRVFPVDMDPRGHPLWCMAEAYGAVCDVQCCERTTHVVAAARGTEKTLWAAQNGKLVVTPAWLECCCTLWRRADEARFLVPGPTAAPA